ncbi:MAG: hypothetical protein IKG08_07700 [Eubacterium sp.]|nr:hypothetical protein [Eubacterium sp.]
MIILILIIVIAVLAIRYFQVAKRTLNEDEFEKEVRRAAGQYRTASRIIHCDYCGGRINPARDRVCPSCGASYRTDSETYRGPDADAVRADAEDYVRRKKEEVKANTAVIRRTLVTLIGIVVILLAVSVIVTVVMNVAGRRRHSSPPAPSSVNEYSWEDYVPVDYKIKGSGLLFSGSNLEVFIEEIYSDADYEEDYRARFRVINRNPDAVYLDFYCLGINGILPSTPLIITYDSYAPGETVFYEDISYYGKYENMPFEEIHSLQFGDFHVMDEHYSTIFSSGAPVTVNTTASEPAEAFEPEGTVIYSKNGVDILFAESYEPYEGRTEHLVWIKNSSGLTWRLNAEEYLGTVTKTVYEIDGRIIPKDCILEARLSSAKQYEEGFEDDGSMRAVFSFTCLDDLEQSFSTGYLDFEASGP